MVDDPLLVLWRVSLLLSLLSIVVLAGLIGMRLINAAGAMRRERAQHALTKLLIEISADQPVSDKLLKRLIANRRLTAQALVEFSTLVRGDDLTAALDRLRAAGLGRRLRPLVDHADKEVRLVVMEALGLLMDDRNESVLKRIVRRGRSLQETVTAARALQSSGRGLEPDLFLGRLKFRRSAAPAELSAVLTDLASADIGKLSSALGDPDIHQSVKVQIISALGASGRYETLGDLVNILGQGEAQERAAAAAALGALGHPSAKSALAAALRDSSPDVRTEAAEAVGLIMLNDLQDELAGLLSDPSWSVRFNAARALLRLGDAGRDRLMKAALEPSDPRAGRTAALMLAEGVAA